MRFRPVPDTGDDKSSLRVFDPRRNEDFKFGPLPGGRHISSKAHDLVVVHVTPRFELISSPQSKVRAAVLASLELEDGIGFICAFAAPKHIERALPSGAQRYGQGMLGHFRATEPMFREHFELLRQLTYGELTIGCATHDLLGGDSPAKPGNAPLPTEDFELLFLLSRPQMLNWLVSFYADTGDALIVARPSDGLDEFLSIVR